VNNQVQGQDTKQTQVCGITDFNSQKKMEFRRLEQWTSEYKLNRREGEILVELSTTPK